MNQIRYRRSLICLLALTLIFAVFYMDRDPLFDAADGDNQVRAQNQESISANAAEDARVYPCGFQVGIYLKTSGVMVIGTTEVEGLDGLNYNPALDKVKPGDYITKVNNIDVSSKNQLLFLVNKYGDRDLILTLQRNGRMIEVKIRPVRTSGREYKMGIWVRDDTQGIGTMTYVTEDGRYGALGHGISDIDTGELLDSEGGILYQANVWGIKKGEDGCPGALYGMISYEDDKIEGNISENSSIGIYGNLDSEKRLKSLIDKYELVPVGVAQRSEVRGGSAVIRSCVSGEMKDYEVEIEKVNRSNQKNKGLVIHVTDPDLLKLTNGIVQGLSGTPILQDGKLIGAVTHVFVNDSTRGYGIFADVMLEETGKN